MERTDNFMAGPMSDTVQPANTADYLHFDTENELGPWKLDRSLIVPVFNLASTGEWDRFLRNIRFSGKPIVSGYSFRLSTLTAVLLFCCLKAVKLQGHTDVSDSKEDLVMYLRDRYPGYEKHHESFLSPWNRDALCREFGNLLVNMLSKALDIRSRSSEALNGVDTDPGDMAELMWEEMLSVAEDGEKALLSGAHVLPCNDSGEIIDGASLEPCLDMAVNSEFLARLYNIQSVAFGANDVIDDWDRANEASFLLSAGLVYELRSLCGSFTPGIFTELFADSCTVEGCTRCRIIPGENHYIVPGASRESVLHVPEVLPGLICTEQDSYYPPFTAILFCCGYLEESRYRPEDSGDPEEDERVSPEINENYKHDNFIGLVNENAAEEDYERDIDKLAKYASDTVEPDDDSYDEPGEEIRPHFSDGYAGRDDGAVHGVPYVPVAEENDSSIDGYETSFDAGSYPGRREDDAVPETEPAGAEEENMTEPKAKEDPGFDLDQVSVEEYEDVTVTTGQEEEASVSLDKPLTPDDFWSQEDEDATKDRLL